MLTTRFAKILGIGILGILLFAKLQNPISAAPGDPPGLFGDSAIQGDAPSVHAPVNERTRFVDINFDLLAGAKTLTLNLFEDVSFKAIFDRIDGVDSHGYIWVGHLESVPFSTVTLVAKDGLMQGQITMAEGIYQVRYAGNGVHAIHKVNQALYPRESEPLLVTNATGKPSLPTAVCGQPFCIFLPLILNNFTSRTIDVLIVYTANAADQAGGITAINALIDLAISNANTSYMNSGVNQRLNIKSKTQTSYIESGNVSMSPDLNRLCGDCNNTGNPSYQGFLLDARTLRDSHTADLVELVVGGYSANTCGIAWLLTNVSPSFSKYGYSVADESCIAGNLTLAHEMGHNMGLRHDWYVDSGVTPYSYAHGFVNLAAGNRWRTVMSYNDLCAATGSNCTRIQYFSNPSINYNGNPTGVAEGTSTSCSVGNTGNPLCDANNAKTLNNTAATIAGFR